MILVAEMCRLVETSNKLRVSHLHLISHIHSLLTCSEHKFLISEMLSLQSKNKFYHQDVQKKL